MPYRFLARGLAALILLALPLAVAHAQTTPPPADTATPASAAPLSAEEKAKAEIQDRLDKQDAAMAKKDIAGALRYLAPDYILIVSDGTPRTLKQIRAGAEKSLASVDAIEISDTVDNVTLKGNTATVEMSASQKITLKDPSGISHTINVEAQARSFWIKGKTGWLMKRSRTIDGGLNLDGKPIRVAKPG